MEIERQLNLKLRDEMNKIKRDLEFERERNERLQEQITTAKTEYEKVNKKNKRIVKTNTSLTDDLTQCMAEHDKLLVAQIGWETNAQETAKNMKLLEARIQKEINEKESAMREVKQRTEELKEVKQKLCVLETRELTNINRLNAEKLNPYATEEIVIKQLGTNAVGSGPPTSRLYRDNYVLKSCKMGAPKVLLENGQLGIWFQSKYVFVALTSLNDLFKRNCFCFYIYRVRKEKHTLNMTW
ncbi:unnamed protein product [Owenia fusiformis]|uniref:Uncharacterized protein n=1 Tax=Owenia fusiformis TaxID=6347 RepID=A0A8S4QA80_OWEFU|nr:unnamed protein product [Owenia fusiformis]